MGDQGGKSGPNRSKNSGDAERKSVSHSDVWRELWPGQSAELLKALHILRPDGSLQADSRRKLKQVLHLVAQMRPWIEESLGGGKPGVQSTSRTQGGPPCSARWLDVGSGKSYLGFIIYDLFMRDSSTGGEVWNLETRADLVARGKALAMSEGFDRMKWVTLDELSNQIQKRQMEGVMALHACDTATDLAIDLGLHLKARWMVLIPCCQAEVAASLPARDPSLLNSEFASDDFVSNPSEEGGASRLSRGSGTPVALSLGVLQELWADPLCRREFGAQLTDTLRVLRLRAAGYRVRVTELVGLEHSMKNRLILAERLASPHAPSKARLDALASAFGVQNCAAVRGGDPFGSAGATHRNSDTKGK